MRPMTEPVDKHHMSPHTMAAGARPSLRSRPVDDKTTPITVVLVDDHVLVREGIASLLAEQSIHVVAQAGSIAEGVRLIDSCRPRVAIIDVELPDGSGLDLCERVSPATRCLVLSATGRHDQFSRAMATGAGGYLLKRAASRQLVTAVCTVAAGEVFVDSALQSELFAAVRRDTSLPAPLARCSHRQLELLLHLADGASTSEIAAALFISTGTCRNWVSRLLRDLGLRNRTEAALLGSAHRSVIENLLRTSDPLAS